MQHNNKGFSQGFTLIEVVVTLLIVGILAAMVLPGYQDSMRKSRRADARVALAELATAQEKFFAQNNTYTTSVSDSGTGLGYGSTTSDEGYYNMTVAACTGGAIARCYVLTATATGTQADDTACDTITLDNVGRKEAEDSSSNASDLCW